MYRTKSWNRYLIKELLKSEDFDPTKFSKDELIQFLAVAMDLLIEHNILTESESKGGKNGQ